MSSNFSRRRVVCLGVALASAVLTAPLAQANHGPRARATAPSSASTWTASGREIDRLGPKYVPLQHPIATARTSVVSARAPVVRVVKPVGFDWADAGIGAATAALALAVVATFALVITRRKRTLAGTGGV